MNAPAVGAAALLVRTSRSPAVTVTPALTSGVTVPSRDDMIRPTIEAVDLLSWKSMPPLLPVTRTLRVWVMYPSALVVIVYGSYRQHQWRSRATPA